MVRVFILADDLTGAADSAAAFLGRARRVSVQLDPGIRSGSEVAAVDLDTRSRSERLARRRVRRALRSRAARLAAIQFKKIDSTLRGHVVAELAAARAAIGRRPVIFAPAFPAQGRVVRNARLVVKGKTVSGDLRALLARAGLPATHVGKASTASFRAALAIGTRAFVCDAATDAELDRVARAGLALRPRPLFVGAAGLARALARTLPRKRPARRGKSSARPVLTVVGSANPVSAGQAARLDARDLLLQIEWRREPTRKDISKVRRLARVAACLPQSHYVLTGGETARAVLGERGIEELRLLGEVEPGVPFGMACDGTLVCTKAGGFGTPDTLRRCAARLKQEMSRK